jgi:hypothetical protein
MPNSLAAVMLVLCVPAAAADAPPVDADFLEFLGSEDSDDADWDALLTASAGDAKKQEPAATKPAAPASKAPTEGKEGDS